MKLVTNQVVLRRSYARPQSRRPVRCNSSPNGNQQSNTNEEPTSVPTPAPSPPSVSSSSDPMSKSRGGKTKAESTDAVASFLTRRFGLAGGLAWFAVLAVGSLGEQVKTRIEVANEEKNVKDVTAGKTVKLASGVEYKDLRIGGGQYPDKGLLVVLNFVAKANGEVFEDTLARGKPIVLLYGARPFTAGVCAGLEEALSTMRAGGKRIVTVPPERGFGSAGAVINGTRHAGAKGGVVPPDATLEYEIELVRVSIPPS